MRSSAMTNTGCLASRETVVVDTSALIAVLNMEPESTRLAAAMEADANRLVSAATVVEAGLVIEARYGSARGPQPAPPIAQAPPSLGAGSPPPTGGAPGTGKRKSAIQSPAP